jgi:hypothetical protein
MFVPKTLYTLTHTHVNSLTRIHTQAFDASKFNGGAVIINKGGEGADR